MELRIHFNRRTVHFLSGKLASNLQPRPWQGRALPIELLPHLKFFKEALPFLYVAELNSTLNRRDHHVSAATRLHY